MLSAPPAIPATFTAAFTPHWPTGRTCSPARSLRPARSAATFPPKRQMTEETIP
jgi:hypothetical protein